MLTIVLYKETMDISTIRRYITLLIYPLFASVPVMSCPDGANTTCCACVSSPGCSWFSPPGAVGYCSTSPYLLSGGHGRATDFPSWSDGGLNGVFPSRVSHVTVMSDEPFHLRERRLLRPQQVRLKLAVGVRFQMLVRLTSRSTRTRLAVSGPSRAADGDVEFGFRPADDNSCSRGLREQNRARQNRNRGGRANRTAAASRSRIVRSSRRNSSSSRRSGRFPTRRVYNCRGDGPGVVHNLLLDVDVKRCLGRRFTLRVLARDSGTRSRPLLVKVFSACECPECSSNTLGTSSAAGDTTSSITTGLPQPQTCDIARCNAGSRVNQTYTLTPQATLCLRRGVNDECVQRDGAAGAMCSGRGLCVCGQCSCQPRHEMFSTQRYYGTHCECDDYSCPATQGVLCGGPGRGVCQCGQCLCHEGWTGDACDMSSSVDSCVAPSSSEDQVCSGRGTCVDGLCECPWPYSGQFCQCDGQVCPLE